MQTLVKILNVIMLCLVVWTGIISSSCAADSISVSEKTKADLANIALKKSLDLGEPSLSQIKGMLSSRDFKAIERLYDGILLQYQKDVLYESPLQKAYNLFDPVNEIALADLDLWVSETESYISYAARGTYKAQQGFAARGGKFISETPDNKIQEMIYFHSQAAKDLQIAISKKPTLMPAYSWLVSIAMASTMPLTAQEILQKAEENDNRSYYVRFSYMPALQPRWGGSYKEMSKYAEKAIKYSDLNPRLWSLQGEVHADLADVHWRNGDYSSAIESYTAAMKLGERVSWLTKRATCYYKPWQKDKATVDFKRALYYSPTDKKALEGLKKLR